MLFSVRNPQWLITIRSRISLRVTLANCTSKSDNVCLINVQRFSFYSLDCGEKKKKKKHNKLAALQLSGPDGAISWGTHFNLINQMSSYSSCLFVVKETLTASCQMSRVFTGRWFRLESPPANTKYFQGCFQVLRRLRQILRSWRPLWWFRFPGNENSFHGLVLIHCCWNQVRLTFEGFFPHSFRLLLLLLLLLIKSQFRLFSLVSYMKTKEIKTL